MKRFLVCCSGADLSLAMVGALATKLVSRKCGVSVKLLCIELGLQSMTLVSFFLTFKYGFENYKISNNDVIYFAIL